MIGQTVSHYRILDKLEGGRDSAMIGQVLSAAPGVMAHRGPSSASGQTEVSPSSFVSGAP